MLRKHPLALAVCSFSALLAASAHAQSPTSETPATANTNTTRLEEVTVSATRSARKIDSVPNTVSVIGQKQAQERIAHDLKDLLADELDLSVRTAPTRFSAAGLSTGRAGSEGINIRGLEGNQVLMMADGIRVPNSFSFAAFSTGRGDYVDLDGLKSAEVLRGPASTQFGSDGLAGAVSFRTLDPADLLKNGKKTGGFVRSAYNGVDSSWGNTVAAAHEAGAWQTMALLAYRKGHETENKGDKESLDSLRTAPNPVDYSNRYLLAKAMLQVNPQHQLGWTIETQRRKQDTEVYSARAIAPVVSPTGTLDLDAHDTMDRDRFSMEHHYLDLNAPWIQKAETKLYWQDANMRQISVEDRNTAADRIRDNTYATKVFGISSLLQSNFSGAVNQRLSYGFDWSRSSIEGVRDGTVPAIGETFPIKPFPTTDYTQAGAFVQDEIEAGAWSIIPGLRFDQYSIKPTDTSNFPGVATTLSDQAFTPKLGVVWRASPQFAPYAQWAKGFRAPTPDQVNNGFSNPIQGYGSIGNPNLKAERANSWELGLRGQVSNVRYSVAAFNNSYKDFITQATVGGSGTPADPTIFQYINLAEAKIKGLEARSEWTINSQWTANAGLSYAKGDSWANGVKAPLETINPLKAVLGLRYDTGIWGARASLTHSQGKAADRTLPILGYTGSTPAFAPGAYTVLDLGFHWKPQANLSLNATINNVFDKKYWRWSDVRGLADNSTVKDAYTAAGRHISLSLRYEF